MGCLSSKLNYIDYFLFLNCLQTCQMLLQLFFIQNHNLNKKNRFMNFNKTFSDTITKS